MFDFLYRHRVGVSIFVVFLLVIGMAFSCVSGGARRHEEESVAYEVVHIVARQKYSKTRIKHVHGGKGEIVASYPVTNHYDYWLYDLSRGERLKSAKFIKPGSIVMLAESDRNKKSGIFEDGPFVKILVDN